MVYITRPNCYLRGQHTQMHASLMPHWGTIWWKNAQRLVECDLILQAPTYCDMLWCLLVTHTQQIQIYYLFGRLCGQIPTTGLTYWAVSVPAQRRKPESRPCKHIFPPKGHNVGFFQVSVRWEEERAHLIHLTQSGRQAVVSLSLSLSLNMHSQAGSNGYSWGIQGYEVWQMRFTPRPGV